MQLHDYKHAKQITDQSEVSSNKSDPNEWIKMIQNGRYDEFATELVNQNIDLTEPIDKQKEDFDLYLQFLILIFDIFGSVSLSEAILFINNLKNDYKNLKSEMKQFLKGMNCVNLRKKYIKFSHQRAQFVEKELFNNVDKFLVQILLLGFIEDYGTLKSVYLNPNTSKYHKNAIQYI